MKHRPFQRYIQACAALACFLSSPAQTLDTGILGTITDPAGAVVAGATVVTDNPASRSKPYCKNGFRWQV